MTKNRVFLLPLIILLPRRPCSLPHHPPARQKAARVSVPVDRRIKKNAKFSPVIYDARLVRQNFSVCSTTRCWALATVNLISVIIRLLFRLDNNVALRRTPNNTVCIDNNIIHV